MYKARIIGTGSYAPEKVLTNKDLEAIVDTTDEWILTRTGIKERHIASNGEASSDFATQAALNAMEMAGVSPEEIDMIIVGTITPDMNTPSVACLVQDKIGVKKAVSFDISAGCTSFLYALSVADKFMMTGHADKILVIGAETLSKITNYEDRGTCILFGDGAGAVVLSKEKGDRGYPVNASFLGWFIRRSSLYARGRICQTGFPGNA